MRASLAIIWLTGCIFRGGAVATYRPSHGAGVEVTGTAAFGQKGSTGPGAAFGVTVSGGYDPLGALAGTAGPSFEYFSPYLDARSEWIFASMLTCGGRFIDEHVNGSIVSAVSCEVRAGPRYLLDDGNNSNYARWVGLDLVVRYAFAGDAPAEGWTLGLAGTWEHWATLTHVR
jgi:hypothetical protein